MRLKNKKTGEIIEFDAILPVKDVAGDRVAHLEYGSIAELNAEWCDVEEDKYYYAITSIKADDGITKMKNKHNDMTAFDKSIGNYFETREEAELAVRKLKAWKRLRNKGFRFDGYDVAHKSNGNLAGQIFYDAGDYCIEDVEKYLDLLFSGGEE